MAADNCGQHSAPDDQLRRTEVAMTEKLNAGAELEKELAEKLGFRVNINAESDEAWISEPGGKYVQDADDGGTVEYVIKLWAALLDYAAEAALYRTQWKDTETLLRAVEQQRDEWRQQFEAESRVAALQAQLETLKTAR